ncbi:hypothetical protein J4E96_13030 [Pengzhenrongella sicca]|uniref:Uncharacterized protein n=1 Tax=Pengzhenrongella sicca TaxID=2819238 RepID=A0A8A4ZJS6_9MICO|nr:hypothetical protein J4E96_13030 [Pengzhenrongella sicca]
MTPEYSAPAGALGVVIFVICLALFVGGFYLMAVSFDSDSALLFVGGLVASSLAFLIPLELLPRLD